MSIKTRYGAQCDSCGFNDLFSHERAEFAQQFVESAGWSSNGDEHTCPTCLAKKPRYTPETN